MRMYEAARSVLRDTKRPMHAKDIHAEIVRRGLFEFGAKHPVSVLSQTLSERSVGGRKSKDPIFTKLAPGTYGLMEWGTGDGDASSG